jgi:hypothetical protein
MSELTTQHYPGADQLWLPNHGMTLDPEFPTPTSDELVRQWQDYSGRQTVAAPGVFGAINLPEGPVRALASVDLCEVVRNTHLGLRSLIEMPDEPYSGNIHRYCDGTPIRTGEDIQTLAQVAMANGCVEPVAGIDEIVDIMREWRENGIYVVANTSTLPGCEPATIDFFRQHMSGAFDGLLLPRNHDGSLPFTKGHAAAVVTTALATQREGLSAIHIDDSPHHNVAFRNEVGRMTGNVRTFQPEYPSHLPPDAGSVITATPLEAFRAADEFFAENMHSVAA